MEIGTSGNQNESVRREHGSCVFGVGRRERTSELNTHVRIESGPPHKNEVLSKFVDT